jgi:cyclohexa-1,5-dienecarbonyl-CoA hydratase
MTTPAASERGSVRTVEPGLWHVRWSNGKANVLDTAAVRWLRGVLREAGGTPGLKCVVLSGEGANFSAGASVSEHLPEAVADMLREFHGLFRDLLDAAVPAVAAVRGACLGGGLELAALCHRVVCARDARLGQPEIALGVFAPVASVALAERVGRGVAEDLCLTGRTLDATEALASGLADEVADDPVEAALAWARKHLLPRSAASLRLAVRAVRIPFAERFLSHLAAAERLYLDRLMRTEDAVEGIRAFLEKRPPRWSDR